MKTIDIIRNGNPESEPYCDSVAVLEDGVELFVGKCSTEPNPYQPTTHKPWGEVYARIAEGQYVWQCMPEHRKYGRCLLINGAAAIPTVAPNPNRGGQYYASGILMHCGDSETWRGSKGCITEPPSMAIEYFGLFGDHETGKLIIRKPV